MKNIRAQQRQSLKKRKIIVLSGLLAIIGAIVAFGVVPHARALNFIDTDALKDTYIKYVDAVSSEIDGGLYKAVADVFIEGGSGGLAEAAAVVRESSLYTDVGNIVKGLACVMIAFYAGFALIRETVRENTSTVEMWSKYFVITMVTVILVMRWERILELTQGLGNWAVTKVYDRVSAPPGGGVGAWIQSKFAWGKDFHNKPLIEVNGILDIHVYFGLWLEDLFLMVWTFIRMLGLTVILAFFEVPLIRAKIEMLILLIEIYLRSAFIPLAISDIAAEGMRSSGVAYIKALFGLYIRVGCCLVIAAICSVIVNRLLFGFIGLDLIEAIFRILLIYIVYKMAPKLFGSTIEISKQIVGVW